MKLAEALQYRKQLEKKVEQLKSVHDFGERGLLQMNIERVKISDEVDEARIRIPRVTMADVTAEYDHHASELRKCDTAIQEANWKTAVSYKPETFTPRDLPKIDKAP